MQIQETHDDPIANKRDLWESEHKSLVPQAEIVEARVSEKVV